MERSVYTTSGCGTPVGGALASVAMENLPCGVLMLSAEGTITFFNHRLAEVLPVTPGELEIASTIEAYIHMIGPRFGWGLERRKRVIENHYAWMAKEESSLVRHYFDDGTVVAVVCQPMPEGGGVLTYQDITSSTQEAAAIQQLAFRDPLTGAMNRRALTNRLDEAFAEGALPAALLFDLDQFKAVNDTYGHAAGDVLLATVTRRVGNLVRDEDHLYRLGGDEMVILTAATSKEILSTLAERIVSVCGDPFRVEGRTISIGASVGVAFPAPGETGDELLRKADLALYSAKASGRGCIRCHRPEMTQSRKTG